VECIVETTNKISNSSRLYFRNFQPRVEMVYECTVETLNHDNSTICLKGMILTLETFNQEQVLFVCQRL
jgi:hypothetical protein